MSQDDEKISYLNTWMIFVITVFSAVLVYVFIILGQSLYVWRQEKIDARNFDKGLEKSVGAFKRKQEQALAAAGIDEAMKEVARQVEAQAR